MNFLSGKANNMNMGTIDIFTLCFFLHVLVFLLIMNRSQARSDLKMEFFHLISFLLSHCMNKWRVPNDQVTYKSIPCINVRSPSMIYIILFSLVLLQMQLPPLLPLFTVVIVCAIFLGWFAASRVSATSWLLFFVPC